MIHIKKTLLTVLTLCVLPKLVAGQSEKIIFDSKNIYKSKVDSFVKRIEKNPGSKYIIIYKENGDKDRICKDSIWGIIDNKNNLWRCYRHLFYKVIDTTSFVKYEIQRASFSGRLIVPKKFYYYSENINSKLYTEREKKQGKM